MDTTVNHNRQKKIAVINDMSGFGRCSLAVAIPIISRMGVQCCALPTAIFSNHTGFPSFFMDDYTRHFRAYAAEWKKLDLHFQGISTGFLGSRRQFRLVQEFLDAFTDPETIVAVDPVMGDYGRIYPSYTEGMCDEMRHLVARADIITPNLTEACILTGTEYHTGVWHLRDLKRLIDALRSMGPERIVITGIPQGDFLADLCLRSDGEVKLTRQYRIGEQRSGTGDVFSAIVIADAVNGVSFDASVRKASGFVKKCIVKSIEKQIPTTDGVCFEEVLGSLH